MYKPVIYISGPISRIPGGNKEAFRDAQALLEQTGHEVLNPHEICQELRRSDFKTDKEFWNACMKACIKCMMDADMVFVLPGYTESQGAMWELENARKFDIPVFILENHTKL